MQITELTLQQINTALNSLVTKIDNLFNSTVPTTNERTPNQIRDPNPINSNAIVVPSIGNVSVTMQTKNTVEIQICKKYQIENNFTQPINLAIDSNWHAPQWDYAVTKTTSEWFADNWSTLSNYTYNYFDFLNGWCSSSDSTTLNTPSVSFSLPYDITIYSVGNQKYQQFVETSYYFRYRLIGTQDWLQPIEFILPPPSNSNFVTQFEVNSALSKLSLSVS